YTIGQFLSHEIRTPRIDENGPEFLEAEQAVNDRIDRLMAVQGDVSVDTFHRKLGHIMWEYCGMARNREGLLKARQMVRELRDQYWKEVYIPGGRDEYNPELEKALRVADFMEMGELMILDALNREESAGGHFREEYQTADGEALRRDEEFAYVGAWSWDENEPKLHKEPLVFENVELKVRSYK